VAQVWFPDRPRQVFFRLLRYLTFGSSFLFDAKNNRDFVCFLSRWIINNVDCELLRRFLPVKVSLERGWNIFIIVDETTPTRTLNFDENPDLVRVYRVQSKKLFIILYLLLYY